MSKRNTTKVSESRPSASNDAQVNIENHGAIVIVDSEKIKHTYNIMCRKYEKSDEQLNDDQIGKEDLLSACFLKTRSDGKEIPHVLHKDTVTVVEEALKAIPTGKPIVFISARSKTAYGSETISYRVARELKNQLDIRGIWSFWWEDFNQYIGDGEVTSLWDKQVKPSMLMSAKVSFGLAFSTIFIALDLDEDDDSYIKNEHCKNEWVTFEKLKENILADYGDTIVSVSRKNHLKKMEFSKYFVSSSNILNSNTIENDNDRRRLTKLASKLQTKLPDNGKREMCMLSWRKDFSKNQMEGIIVDPQKENIQDQSLEGKVNYYVSFALHKIQEKYNKKQLPIILHKLRKLTQKKDILFHDIVSIKGFDINNKYNDLSIDLMSKYFHESTSTPADWYFKWAIIDDKGEDASEKFDFFLERDYTETGDPCVNVCMVINDWNNYEIKMNRYNEARKRPANMEPEHVEPQKVGLANYDQIKIKMDAVGSEAAEMDAVGSEADGNFTCYWKKSADSSESINGPKIEYYNDYGLCKLKHNVTKTQYLHCTISLDNNDNNELFELFAVLIKKKVIFTFSKKYTNSIYTLYLPACSTDKDSNSRLASDGTSEVKCLYCRQTLVNPRKHGNRKKYKNGQLFCSGKESETETGAGDQIICKDIKTLDGGELKIRKLPVGYGKQYFGAIVALVAASSSGKSTFLSRLLQEDDSNSPSKFLNKFFTHIGGFEIYYWEKSVEPFSNYKPILYGKLSQPTKNATSIIDACQNYPIICKVGNSYMSIFDAPGGSFETSVDSSDDLQQTSNDDAHAYKHAYKDANLILILLNNNIGSMKVNKSIVDNMIKILKGKRNPKKKVAVAVVLGKFDQWLETNEKVKVLKDTELNMQIGYLKNRYYKRTAISKHIDACSSQIIEYLKNLDNTAAKEIVKLIQKNFKYYKFFTLSAIGYSKSIDCPYGSQEANARFLINPIGFENIFTWFAYQIGELR